MKLLFKLPVNIKNQVENVIYALPFDISEEKKDTDGFCVVTKSEIVIFENEKLIKSFSFKNKNDCEFNAFSYVGSGSLLVKNGEDEKFLCGFTQKLFIRYAELCKILNYYVLKDQFIEDHDENDEALPGSGLYYFEKFVKNDKDARLTSAIKKLILMCKPYAFFLSLSIFLSIVGEIVNIIQPSLYKILIDKYITPAVGGYPTNLNGFWLIILTLALIWSAMTVIYMINGRISNKTAAGISRDLRNLTYAKLQDLSLTSMSKRTTGELINRVIGDTGKVQNFLTNTGKELILRIFTFVVLTIVLFSANAKLAMLIYLPIPFVVLLSLFIKDKIGYIFWKLWRKWSIANSYLHDILSGIRAVKSAGKEDLVIGKYETASKNWRDITAKSERYWAMLIPLLGFIITSGEFLVLYFGGKEVLGNALTLGQLIQFTSYTAILYGPLRWIVYLPRMISDALVSANKLFEIIDEKNELITTDKPIDLDIKGDILFDDVTFGYKSYEPVLRNITLKIKQGEMVGLVGHSGAGKTTMINLVMRLYDANGGKILVDGINIKDISQQSLRGQIGVVLQENFLFVGTILDNIKYARPEATIEEVIKAAKIANAHDFIVKLPDAYNTWVGEKGQSLSGGERQRIAIARAILPNPKIIILDEATSSLDSITESQIQEALSRLIKDRTTIAIAHRLSTLRNADRLLVLDKGRLKEEGTHLELMKQKGIYYDLVMAQRQTTKMKEEKPS